MGDIDFDELDKAVERLMDQHENRSPKTTDRPLEQKPDRPSNLESDQVAVKVKPKQPVRLVSKGKIMDFVPRNRPKAKAQVERAKVTVQSSSIKTVKTSLMKEPVQSQVRVPRPTPLVKKTSDLRQNTEPLNQSRADVSPNAKASLSLDEPAEELRTFNPQDQTVSLVERADLKIASVTEVEKSESDVTLESDFKPAPAMETVSKSESEPAKEIEPKPKSPEQYNSPFIDEAKVEKRPLGGPGIGRIEDPNTEPRIRSSAVIGDKETKPLYQTDVEITPRKKRSILSWILWILLLIALGIGIGVLLFENPFGWNLPNFL